MTALPLSAAEAKQSGSKYYFTGKPCKHGHIEKRAAHNGVCMGCLAKATKQWVNNNPGKMAEYQQAYRERNYADVRKKDRELKAALRQQNPEKYRQSQSQHYRRKVLVQHGREVRTANKFTEQEIAARLHTVHEGNYTYVTGYTNMTQVCTFRCLKHDLTVDAIPHNVLRGAEPCPRCNHMKSKEEFRIATWLRTFTTVVQRGGTLIDPYELDIYLPEHNLAIEYSGMFYHSARSMEQEKGYQTKHIHKHFLCQQRGIRLITIYESEWLARPKTIMRLLRNAINKSKGSVMARKCDVRKVEHADAVAFYGKYHPQGGAGAGVAYGLYYKNKLVACMRFAFGVNDRGAGAKNASWTLSRYASRIKVVGGASKLFKAFVQAHDPAEVKSFSDNRYFNGATYPKLGFVLDAELPEDYLVWSPKLGVLPKSAYQRRAIPQRLIDHKCADTFDPKTDPRTEAQMTYLMKCGRIYDCGKKRWVWRKSTS